MKKFLVKSISAFAVLLVMASFCAAVFATENDDVVDTVEVVQGDTVVTDIILLDSGYACVTKEIETLEGTDDVTPAAAFAAENDDVVDTVEVVQGDTVVTDIILLDSDYVCVTKETETLEGADDVTSIDLSSEIEWWEQFNSLTPDQQARINFRPNRGTTDFNESFPKETTPQ